MPANAITIKRPYYIIIFFFSLFIDIILIDVYDDPKHTKNVCFKWQTQLKSNQ